MMKLKKYIRAKIRELRGLPPEQYNRRKVHHKVSTIYESYSRSFKNHIQEGKQKQSHIVVRRDDVPQEWLKKAIHITSRYEGHFLAGNFDGQGMSFGLLNWCVGQGSFQTNILYPLALRVGKETIDNMFPRPITPLLDMSNKDAVAYISRYQINNKFTKKWVESFNRLHEITKDVEQVHACSLIARKAYKYMLEYGTSSPMSYCFFFDVVVQNGSMKGTKKPLQTDLGRKVAADVVCAMIYTEIKNPNRNTFINYIEKGLTEEQALLCYLIAKRAKRNKWRLDVLDRKLSIIFGGGVVHHQRFSFKYDYLPRVESLELNKGA